VLRLANWISLAKLKKTKGIYRNDGNDAKVAFQCDNPDCEYYNIPLPLDVVDDYIYENPPTLLLGTVDKFAMVNWKEKAGNLFGFRYDEINEIWYRIKPPELIIQDELHLISGPLRTMVGLYETMIQTLCNDYKMKKAPFLTDGEIENYTPPKIIASTDTISRAFEQVQSLYAIKSKDYMSVFPAQGLSFGDTWFSKEESLSEEDQNGKKKYPGRKYIGILASGYASEQTAIVRAYSAVLQKVKELDNTDNIDYYWTLLGYFNSIRELGATTSLVSADIKERLNQIQNRELIKNDDKRYINKQLELTSRISSSQIPQTLKMLEVNFRQNNNPALDICLATNMVATGVDIQRLGLMFIHGQPKTTAEYIQASSRVGRDLPDGPGLIVTLYSPTKPRDKSQYEQFQSYHSRIYSMVEPTSITPFSFNARKRGLHSVLIGLIRHFSISLRVNPIIERDEFDLLSSIFINLIEKRCKTLDEFELEYTQQMLIEIIKHWQIGFQNYGDAGNYYILQNRDVFPLMYATGSEVRDDIVRDKRSLPTPTSMRGVDTESIVKIVSEIIKEDNE
jgi:hypothetical protein